MLNEDSRDIYRRTMFEASGKLPTVADYNTEIDKLKAIADKHGLEPNVMSQYVHPFDNSENPFHSAWMRAHTGRSFLKSLLKHYPDPSKAPSKYQKNLRDDWKELQDKLKKLDREIKRSVKRQALKDAGKLWR